MQYQINDNLNFKRDKYYSESQRYTINNRFKKKEINKKIIEKDLMGIKRNSLEFSRKPIPIDVPFIKLVIHFASSLTSSLSLSLLSLLPLPLFLSL